MKLLYYTTLFTVKGDKAEDNFYVFLFLAWFRSLINVLDEGDDVLLYVDDITFNYLSTSCTFNSLNSKINNKVNCIVCTQPNTIYEGLFYRFNNNLLDKIAEFNKDYIVYCDIDNHFIKNIKSHIISTDIPILYAYHPTDAPHNYTLDKHVQWEKINKEKLSSIPYFNSGIFIFKSHINTFTIIKSIYKTANDIEVKARHMCADQDEYNFTIISNSNLFNNNIMYIDYCTLNSVISDNKPINDPTYSILALDGYTAEGDKHMDKLFWCFFNNAL